MPFTFVSALQAGQSRFGASICSPPDLVIADLADRPIAKSWILVPHLRQTNMIAGLASGDLGQALSFVIERVTIIASQLFPSRSFQEFSRGSIIRYPAEVTSA